MPQKNHPVSINYTGAPNQALTLRLARVASTLGTGEEEGAVGDIALDDLTFAQLPESVLSTGPQVVSVTPSPGQGDVPAADYSYVADIANGASTVATNSIQLAFDGNAVSPAPVIGLDGDLTRVSYTATNLVASGSMHNFRLTYADNLGATYTNEVVFTAANYQTLPASYANPAGSGITRGFTFRTVAAPQDISDQLESTLARAKAQLAGTLIDTNTGAPYTNVAALGTNTDGSFTIDTVLNFDDDSAARGNFQEDQPFPGLEFGPNNWFSTEALLNLDLPAGYYRFGVNSDDGFEVNVLPLEGVAGAPIRLGFFDNGRGADDTLFDFLAEAAGVYRFQVIYFESNGNASLEFFSVTNFATGDMVLINDPANANAIRAYRVLAPSPLRITNIARSGTDAVISWAFGTPPFQLQLTTNLVNASWSDLGEPTTNRSATVPILPGAGFFRVSSQ